MELSIDIENCSLSLCVHVVTICKSGYIYGLGIIDFERFSAVSPCSKLQNSKITHKNAELRELHTGNPVSYMFLCTVGTLPLIYH